MKTTMFRQLAPLMLLIAVLFHLFPRMRKRNLYFAVTVPEEFRESEEGRAIARTFRIRLWVGTIAALGVCWLALERGWILPASLALQLQIAVILIAWVLAWRRTRHYAAAPGGVRTADLFAQPEGAPGGLLPSLLPFLGPLGASAYLWSNYAELPARYPVHWNIAGQADRYVAKSPMAVFFSPMMSVSVLLLMSVITLVIRFGTRRGSSGEHAGWASRFRRLNLTLLLVLMWIVSAMTSTVSLAPLLEAGTIARLMALFLGSLLVALVVFIVPLVRMSMQRTGGTDATPDECWKGGLIYYNPADPVLMVERRDGIGFTLNFGNRLSWWLLGLILLLVIGPLLLMRGLR